MLFVRYCLINLIYGFANAIEKQGWKEDGMKKLLCMMVLSSIISVGLSVGFGVGLANAALIEKDLFAIGDGLVTLDTDTNLEWLDLTQTLNLSHDQIIAGAGGWTGIGFTYATTTQVTALFIASDPLNVIINSSTSDNFAGASLLLDLMGCTEDNGQKAYKFKIVDLFMKFLTKPNKTD